MRSKKELDSEVYEDVTTEDIWKFCLYQTIQAEYDRSKKKSLFSSVQGPSTLWIGRRIGFVDWSQSTLPV